MPSTRGAAGPLPAKPPPPASTASSSSFSSARQDRNARLDIVAKSATPQSRSSEEMSEPPRRSQRSYPSKKDDGGKDEADADEEAIEEEEEVTRCICGQQDYPGPALSDAFRTGDSQPEDAGGLFISCDGCSVWQHGGCVGIFEESQVPDKYYCEECKPKLHELHTDSQGQNYSLYQPVYAKTSRKPSVSKHGDKTKQDPELAALRASTDPATGKRRATMRSKEHDDEEEQMRRAIEESKRELGGSGTGNGRRSAKRGREDSEDQRTEIKRARRASELVPPTSKAAEAVEESDDELRHTQAIKGKKARADAVQSVRQAELREKEKEREKLRAEAAGRRQERAGRRRTEDEPEDDTPGQDTSAKPSPPPSSQPESPPPPGPSPPTKRGPGKKTKKLGNNQYTKLRGGPTSSPPNGKKSQSTSNGQGISSGDEPLANGDGPHKGNGTNKNSPERSTGVKGKFGKGKTRLNGGKHNSEDPLDPSMTTMRRNMEAMAAFITKAQRDRPKGGVTPGGAPGLDPTSQANADGTNGDGGAVQPSSSGLAAELANERSLDDMNAIEMGDVLLRQIGEWQQRFAHVV